ncbi:Threonine-phosphate decarboxylase [Andreprevotia sp. IGB-42]|uniref:threonine-phosphate decarboxylase CobD n=1 Tax=Andreprevotia sp. IGB-42 TaxID=2497473 RepID=UPI00135A59AC|nr:threonine-phosphate decarboxylase CobD [Andreprevotia sp. IGB-42]KAF0813320.1 Threonine-phosphate decarboxylase [Andreprevotia sp. IGB-42]
MLQAVPFVPHGGNLATAIAQYGRPREAWLDLSTGINPNGYPVPALGGDAWLRLPEDGDDLEAIAASHYGAPAALAVAGTQAAIRMLPAVLPLGSVGIGLLTYGEYAPAFAAAGFEVLRFVTEPVADLAEQADFSLLPGQPLPAQLRHLVIVNPNNPTATLYTPEVLLGWHRQLCERGGSLIVDEAFMDALPLAGLAAHTQLDGLIVLRSIGKFFGLAGARVGFVLAAPAVLGQLAALRGPWSISGPARAVVRMALLDDGWQAAARRQLQQAGPRLAALLAQAGFQPHATPLFAWAPHPHAAQWQHHLAQQGIWVRRFEHVPSLRFGLPAGEQGWQRLGAALAAPFESPSTSPSTFPPGNDRAQS